MKIVIELYLPDDQEVNDINIGRALGEALMTNELKYTCISDFKREYLCEIEE